MPSVVMDGSAYEEVNHPLLQRASHHIIIYSIITLICVIPTASSLLCYTCTSNEPGCTLEKVDWMIHSAHSCPKTNDKCVKIIEQRGASLQVLRGCLSEYLKYRDDVPADHYEGCRASSILPKRAVYVQNHVHELQLAPNTRYFNNVTWCFCEFDHWCNSAPRRFSHSYSIWIIMSIAISVAILSSVFRLRV